MEGSQRDRRRSFPLGHAASWVLLISLLFLGYGHAQTADFNDLHCHMEELPRSLNSLTYLQFNGEFHTHSNYWVDFGVGDHNIHFHLDVQSSFRVTVAEHEVDMDLWLYNDTSGSSLAHSSLNIGTEEVIEDTLPPGDYYLKISFFGFWIGWYQPQECDSVTMEMAVAPTTVLSSRGNQLTCPPSENIPEIHFGKLSLGESVSYDSDIDDAGIMVNVRSLSSNYQYSVRWIHGYNFTIPAETSASLWRLDAVLGYEFMFGGSLGLMVQPASSLAPYLPYSTNANKTIGQILRKGENVLKSALSPGNYTLWLYESTGEKSDLLETFVDCTPFSFRVSISKDDLQENSVTCSAARVPQQLLPGFDEPKGFIHYRENALVDSTQGKTTTTFTIEELSYFRVLTEPHRLDIDMKLIDGLSGQQLAYSFNWDSSEESIVSYLQPGTYNLTIIFFGIFDAHFCETFDLEIAVAPASLYSAFPTCTTVSPNLQALPAQLLGSGSFSFPDNQTFTFLYGGDYSARDIYVQNFTVQSPSAVGATLGFDFLLGSLDISIVSYGDQANTRRSYHKRNLATIHSELEAGSYGLVISTSEIQDGAQLGNHFPNCARYTLGLMVEPLVSAGSCWKHRRVPKDLNTVPYLGNPGVVHIVDDFLVPLSKNQFSTMESVKFTVEKQSFFRVWTEPHIIDVDFYLYAGNTYLNRSDSFNGEEELIWKLEPNHSYQLDIIYYHYTNPDPHAVEPLCFLFALELAIAPVSPNPATCAPSLPAMDFIANYTSGNDLVEARGEYQFTQSSGALSHLLPFTLADFVYFRAVIEYDFIWADLSLRLYVEGQKQPVYGSNLYNRYDLDTILLGPGNYLLEIYEPAAMTLPEFQRCVSFKLFVVYEPTDGAVSGGSSSLLGCSDSYLPASLQSQAFLSVLSGQQFHIERNILVDVSDRKDEMHFILQSQSVFKIFIPRHPVVDVDITLKKSDGTIIDQGIGTVEETMVHVLEAGSYVFSTRYYGLMGAKLPPASDCTYFPAEISITPLALLQSVPALTTTCASDALPATLEDAHEFLQVFSRSLGTAYKKEAMFSLPNPTVFKSHIQFNFPSGALSLELFARIDPGLSSERNKTIFSQISTDHAFIHTALPAGDYILKIEDPFTPQAIGTLKCSQFSFQYYFNSSSLVPDFCDDTADLPTDLYSPEGGSSSYGGPQAADGNVRIFGEEFLMRDDPDSRDHYILFKVPQESFLRLYASGGPNDDIDFFLYNNVSRPASSLVGYSVGIESVESKLFRLPGQPNDYVLDMSFWEVDGSLDQCPTFYFELAMKPVETVRQELLCPAVLPSPEVPPPSYDLTEDVWEYTEEYYFTKDRIMSNIDAHTQLFNYRITLTATTNTTIFSVIGYDFLANDFHLRLVDSKDQVVVSIGEAGGAEDRTEYYNFFSFLYATVEPGVYYLDILEDLRNKPLDFDEYCHQFWFFLASFSEGGQPEVEYLIPAGGQNLNPYEDLTINIAFSEPIAHTWPTNSLLNWLSTAPVIYLFPTGQPATHINAVSAALLSDDTMLEVTFFSGTFAVGQSYVLYFDATKFASSEDSSLFKAFEPSYTFTMATCSCGGHGHCLNGASLSCICDAGYSGPTCSACDQGYHSAAQDCVANVPCSGTSCNGHGTCDDTLGYPRCICDDGFATTGASFCTACAAGYNGYPNCTSNGDPEQRTTRCTTPLIPDDLDTIGLLEFNGAVHLQGNYFIDVDNRKHDTTFTVYDDSLIRVYVEPHWIDIDIWLYKVNEDGTTSYIDNGIAIGEEEVIFHELSGSASSPTKYILRFRYFIWDLEHTIDCENFNLEVAIAPKTKVQAEYALMQSSCTDHDVLPTPPAVGTIDYSYSPDTLFSVKSSASYPKREPHYFFKWNFEIAPPAGKAAVFNALVGYRFLAGDLSLILERGAEEDHCGASGGYDDACENGVNLDNQNEIRQVLLAGNYTLWVYEPEPQMVNITACSVFSFQVNVTFIDLEEDVFYCPGRVFPSTFNSPGFLDSRGYMHIQEWFLIDEVPSVFDLQFDSVLRVHGNSDSMISFQIRKNETHENVKSSWFGRDPEIFLPLQAGVYYLVVSSFMVTDTFCPTVNMELELSPVSLLPHSCPGTESLPQLPGLASPYQFPVDLSVIPTTYYAYTNNDVIQEYTFTLDQVSTLEVALDSDFLVAGLELSLSFYDQQAGYTRTIRGTHYFNRNFLREILDPAEYTLRLVVPDSTAQSTVPPQFPPCAAFNLQLTLKPMSLVDEEDCLNNGEAIPLTFNTVRFLGDENEFDFQTSEARVPAFSDFIFHSLYSSLQVTVPSVIRVYTEPHVIDIDISLYVEGQDYPIADAGYSFNDAESFVFLLEANKMYELETTYWKWTSDIPDCPIFNMEVAVVPVSVIEDGLNRLCPNNGQSRWPSINPNGIYPQTEYHYNSLRQGELLYYQQSSTQKHSSPAIRFTITDHPANVYAQVGYEFITGDLLLQLDDVNNDNQWFGKNELDGSVLTIVGLNPGTYDLTIIEVTQNLDIYTGCSNFTFSLDIEKDSKFALAKEHPFLPQDLNDIAFLKFGGHAHLQDWYTIFSQGMTEEIPFTVTQQSFLRVSTNHYLNEYQETQIVILSGNGDTYAAAQESIVELLPPGAYTIQLNRPLHNQVGIDVSGDIIVELEIQISPVATVGSELQHYRVQNGPNCADSTVPHVTLNPKGYYHYTEDHLLVSKATMINTENILQIPFTLEQASVVYASLGFQFLVSDFELSITGTKASTSQPVEVYGRNGKNSHDINEVLPAGSYVLNILQPILDTVVMTQIPHCTVYSLNFIIKDEASENSHVDCSDLNILPWNLNTQRGGSVPYGGPIDQQGILHLFGEHFLMPVAEDEVDTLAVNITKRSLMSVITKQTYYGDISYAMNRGTAPMQLISSPISSFNDFSQRSELFVLDLVGTKTQYELDLAYTAPYRVACPYFGMQVIIEPLEEVGRTLVCPSVINEQLPKKTFTTDSHGVYSEFLESYFTSTTIANHQEFSYEIQFSVNQTSRLISSLSYNALSSMFRVRLEQEGFVAGTRFDIGRGMFAPQRQRSGDTNINLSMTGTFGPGQYFITISQPAIQVPFFISLGTKHCYPFIWDLQIVPDDGFPYIASVQPSGGEYLSPDEDLQLQVTFSEKVFHNNVEVTGAQGDALKQAIYIVDTQNAATKIAPSTVEFSSGRTWNVAFPKIHLSTMHTYKLQLTAGILQSETAKNVELITTHLYSMIDTTCNNKGEFDSGYCFCDIGYGGEECTTCDVGYENTNPSGLKCEKKEGSLCFENTCGCQPNTEPCISIGTCADSTGVIVCSCPDNYGGDRCQLCAAGYENYDAGCPKSHGTDCPTCQHGTCDGQIKKCVCFDHFAGSTCDECDVGWSGSDCSSAVVGPKPIPGEGKTSGAVKAFRVIGIIIAVLVAVSTVGFLLYRKFIRKTDSNYLRVMEELNTLDEDM